MSIRRGFLPVLVLLWTSPLQAQPTTSDYTTSLCTLDVVLVTFKDTSATTPTLSNDYDYHNYDLPYGYTRASDGALNPGSSSYTMDDFLRLFSGGYDYSVNGETPETIPAFTGTGQTVANGTQTLPEVFGSLRHYLETISGGAYRLHVRILNRERNGYPVWVQVPNTKEYYATNRDGTGLSYWNDALMAMRDSVSVWGLPAAYNPPDHNDMTTWPPDRLLRRKVLYLACNVWFRDTNSLIHPRADDWGGYRYTAGERQGSGSEHHEADRFGPMGTHAHEFGHLLNHRHQAHSWIETNPYTHQTTDPAQVSSTVTALPPGLSFGVARTAAWGVMQGSEGPMVEGRRPGNGRNAYAHEYWSCPQPISAPYRHALGWITPTSITGTTLDQQIQPGSFYTFEGADDLTYTMEFRTAEGFGQYASWYRFTEAPGLLIWKSYEEVRTYSSGNQDVRLQTWVIPADERRIYDARTDAGDGGPTRRQFTSTFNYIWLDRLSDPFGAPTTNNHRETFRPMPYYAADGDGNDLPATMALDRQNLRPVVTAADDGHFQVPNVGVSRSSRYTYSTSPTASPSTQPHSPSRRAVRNIRVTRTGATGYADVDVYFDHWVGPIDGMETWGPGPVHVGGDVTIQDGASLTIADNTTVCFLAPLGTDANDRPELIVADGGNLTVGTGVTFGSLNRAGARTASHGLRVETGGTATLNGVTVSDGEHRWSGVVTVGGDLHVSGGTTAGNLVLEQDTQIRFAAGDAANAGQDPARAEVIVRGTLTATETGIAFLSASDTPSEDDWHGIRVQSGGTATLNNVTFRHGTRCLESAGTLTISNTAFSDCGMISGESESSALEFPEDFMDVVDTYTANTLIGDSVEWSLVDSGDDDAFVIHPQQGVLRFDPAPDFEALTEAGHDTDSNGNMVLHVQVRAVESGNQVSVDYPVTITVTNVDEEGRVELSSAAPKVGDRLTAELTDPDQGIGDVRWQWQPLPPGPRSTDPATGGESTDPSLVVTTEHIGLTLTALATYVDGESEDADDRKSAQSAETAPVVHVPSAPREFEATAGNGQVKLRWQPPLTDNGSALTGYVVGHRSDGGANWMSETLAVTTRHTVRDLTNDTEYSFEVRAVNGVGEGAAASATATPVRSDTPGRIELSATSPKAGKELTPTLIDPDAPVQETGWRWLRMTPTSRDEVATTRQYRPQEDDISYGLRVEVSYSDEFGAQHASALTEAVQPGPPGPPVKLKAAPGDGQVTLTWKAARDNGAPPIQKYQYQRLDAPGWILVPGGGSARDQEVTGLSNGEEYTFEVRAKNPKGWGLPAQAAGTPRASGRTVSFEAAAYEATEGGEAATVTVILSSAADPSLKIPITRDPASGDYTVTWPGVEDTLSFAGSTTSLSFTITATEDEDEDEETVLLGFGDLPDGVTAGTPATATVRLVDDGPGTPGSVSLSTTSPEVGRAVTATLTDADGGVSDTTWQWQSRTGVTSSWSDVSLATLSRYEPQATDAGRQLRATVSYTDAHGPGNSAQSAATDAVDTPGTVSLSTTSPEVDQEMTATLVDVDGSLSGLTWQWQRRADAGSAWVNFDQTARTPIASTSRYTPVAADVGKQLRATVGYTDAHGSGNSAQSEPTAAVVDDPGTPGSVNLSTTSPEVGRAVTATLSDADGGVSDTTWQWQSRTGVTSSWSDVSLATLSRYEPQATDAGRQLRATVSYTDAHGPGKSAQSAATDAVDTPGTVSLSTTSPEVDQEMTATLVDVDGSLSGLTWQWQRRADAGSAWVNFDQTARTPIASTSRYTPVAADVGKQLRATVSYTDAHGSGNSAQSEPTAAVVDDPGTPGSVNLSTTSPEVGREMTATLSDADAGVSDTTWQWQSRTGVTSSWSDVSLATLSRYEPQATDAGRQLRATVSYTDAHGPGNSAQSAATDAVDTPGTVSLSTTSPEVDQEMTATLVDVDGSLSGLTWQWQRRADAGSAWVNFDQTARTPIASTSRYTPVAADVGKQLRATVGYTDAHGPGNSAQSEPTAAVVDDPGTPGSVNLSTTSPEVGRAVTATLSDADAGVSDTTWQWQSRTGVTSSWSDVSLATLSRYEPQATDAGRQLRATVSYTDAHGPGNSAQSAATDAVDTPGTVSLSTTSPEVDQEMTATLVDVDGSLSGLTWQWQRRADAGSAWVNFDQTARTPIASTSRYTPVAADVGKQLRATVGYTDAHGSGNSAQSEPTAAVVDDPGTPGSVNLSTTSPEVGREMTATLVDLDGSLSGLTWQWQRRADAGSAWEPLGQTERNPITDTSRYTPGEADRGQQLRATVSYTDAHGPGNSAQSAATSSVRPADTPGTVSLSTASPEVGQRVTATLTDFDGALEAVAWQWQRRADAGSAWEPLEQPERNPDLIVDLSRYTPVAADRGKQLRATVGYTDAHGPNKSAQSAATSSVRPADTPGTVSLSTASPEVGQRVTATLTDFDGALEAVAWQWQRRADAGSAWEPLEQPERNPDLIVDLSRYTPVAADRGKQLRATVGYTDAHGPNKSAQSAATSSVRPADTPGTVSLSTASPEVGQRVTATLTDFDGALEAVAWQWQRRADAGSAWEPLEQPVAADRSATPTSLWTCPATRRWPLERDATPGTCPAKQGQAAAGDGAGDGRR